MLTQYLKCSCGTYLDRQTRDPVAVTGPEVLTLGIFVCERCQGTPWDVLQNAMPGENAGETRRRIGYYPGTG